MPEALRAHSRAVPAAPRERSDPQTGRRPWALAQSPGSAPSARAYRPDRNDPAAPARRVRSRRSPSASTEGGQAAARLIAHGQARLSLGRTRRHVLLLGNGLRARDIGLLLIDAHIRRLADHLGLMRLML